MRSAMDCRPSGRGVVFQLLVGAFFLLGVPGGSVPAASPVLDENVTVLHFERMEYPLYAKVRHIQGAVVLKATVDSTGQVVDAVALSGPKGLLKDSIDNIKKWRFSRPRQAVVMAVYWFRFAGLCELPCPSGFEFYPPNLVIVTTGNSVAIE
jgi:hypothetical protein